MRHRVNLQARSRQLTRDCGVFPIAAGPAIRCPPRQGQAGQEGLFRLGAAVRTE